MNTISVQNDRTARLATNGIRLGQPVRPRAHGARFEMPWPAVKSRRPVPEWKLPQPLPQVPAVSDRTVKSIWLAPQRDSLVEKLFLGLIAVAALAAIGYGSSCVLDLLQNPAALNAGVAQLLH